MALLHPAAASSGSKAQMLAVPAGWPAGDLVSGCRPKPDL